MTWEWLYAWWASITGKPPPDPWSDDPYILHEREHQHERGVADAAQKKRLEDDLARRRLQRKHDA